MQLAVIISVLAATGAIALPKKANLVSHATAHLHPHTYIHTYFSTPMHKNLLTPHSAATNTHKMGTYALPCLPTSASPSTCSRLAKKTSSTPLPATSPTSSTSTPMTMPATSMQCRRSWISYGRKHQSHSRQPRPASMGYGGMRRPR